MVTKTHSIEPYKDGHLITYYTDKYSKHYTMNTKLALCLDIDSVPLAKPSNILSGFRHRVIAILDKLIDTNVIMLRDKPLSILFFNYLTKRNTMKSIMLFSYGYYENHEDYIFNDKQVTPPLWLYINLTTYFKLYPEYGIDTRYLGATLHDNGTQIRIKHIDMEYVSLEWSYFVYSINRKSDTKFMYTTPGPIYDFIKKVVPRNDTIFNRLDYTGEGNVKITKDLKVHHLDVVEHG